MKALPNVSRRALSSRTALCEAFTLTSAGREGVYRAVNAGADERSEKIHVVVHDITDGNVRMVKKGHRGFHHRTGT